MYSQKKKIINNWFI